MDICIDFDGTCVTHEFPYIGEDIGAVPVLKELVENGHRLILFTMRSDRKIKKKDQAGEDMIIEENYLTAAVEWFQKNEIPLYGIQKNPSQQYWTSSPKAYGQLYIDDAGLGCPLIYPNDDTRPYVDWKMIRCFLMEMGLIYEK